MLRMLASALSRVEPANRLLLLAGVALLTLGAIALPLNIYEPEARTWSPGTPESLIQDAIGDNSRHFEIQFSSHSFSQSCIVSSHWNWSVQSGLNLIGTGGFVNPLWRRAIVGPARELSPRFVAVPTEIWNPLPSDLLKRGWRPPVWELPTIRHIILERVNDGSWAVYAVAYPLKYTVSPYC